MQFEEIYQYIGQIGVYQICVLILIFGFDLFSLDSTTMIFVGADMPHWCRIERLMNISFDRQKDIGIPYTAEAESQGQGRQEYDSCKMFALNYSAYSDDELYNWNRKLMINESTPLMDCTQWVYDQTTFVSTIVSRVKETIYTIDSINILKSLDSKTSSAIHVIMLGKISHNII